MPRPKVGDRVGAISHSDGDVLYMFGWGTYQGDEVPPPKTRGPFGDHHKWGIANPKIMLDDGGVVWGCQCWWGSEAAVKARVAKYREVKTQSLPEWTEEDEQREAELQAEDEQEGEQA